MTRVWDRIRDWVMLFGFLATAVVLMLAQNQPLVRGLRAAALEGTAWLEARFAWAGGYFRALQENEVLREENILLSSEVARSREAMIENERLHRMIGFRDTTALQLLAARVIDKDETGEQQYLTLDVGTEDSVAVGMAVVDERGIIGKVVLTSEHYARVMTYYNTEFRAPAKIQPLQASGIVRREGDRTDRLLLEHIVKTEPVQKGQLVVTSGFSGTFPPGYPVGVVDSISAATGRNALSIYVLPAAPISNAEHAFVILQLPEPELLELQTAPLP
jgi:rod shape-determining protein MreC